MASADMAECCHSQGLDAAGESVMTRGCLPGRGRDSLKPLFVWEEKGSLWLVTWETE